MKEIRSARGLSQRKMSREMGISETELFKIEKGVRDFLGIHKLRDKISSYLKVSSSCIEFMLTEVPNEFNQKDRTLYKHLQDIIWSKILYTISEYYKNEIEINNRKLNKKYKK